MLMSGMLRRLLLAGTCLCVCGSPVHLSDSTPTQDSSCDGECASLGKTVRSTHTTDDTEHVSGLNVGAGGGAGPHGRPEGIAPLTQMENGDSLDGRSGRSEAGGEARSQRGEVKNVGSSSEMGDADRQSEAAPGRTEDDKPVTNGQKSSSAGEEEQRDIDMSTSRLTPGGRLASSSPPPQLESSYSLRSNQDGEDRARLPGGGGSLQDKDAETSSPSFIDPPTLSARIQRLASHSPIPSLVFATPRTSASLTVWGHNGATVSSLPDPLLPEMGPNLMPREDGPESLWTEAARPSGGKSEEFEKNNYCWWKIEMCGRNFL